MKRIVRLITAFAFLCILVSCNTQNTEIPENNKFPKQSSSNTSENSLSDVAQSTEENSDENSDPDLGRAMPLYGPNNIQIAVWYNSIDSFLYREVGRDRAAVWRESFHAEKPEGSSLVHFLKYFDITPERYLELAEENGTLEMIDVELLYELYYPTGELFLYGANYRLFNIEEDLFYKWDKVRREKPSFTKPLVDFLLYFDINPETYLKAMEEAGTIEDKQKTSELLYKYYKAEVERRAAA